jgi:hypothetical protein
MLAKIPVTEVATGAISFSFFRFSLQKLGSTKDKTPIPPPLNVLDIPVHDDSVPPTAQHPHLHSIPLCLDIPVHDESVPPTAQHPHLHTIPLCLDIPVHDDNVPPTAQHPHLHSLPLCLDIPVHDDSVPPTAQHNTSTPSLCV